MTFTLKRVKPEALEVGDLIRTTTLAGENSRFDTYDAPDEINVWGSQEALF